MNFNELLRCQTPLSWMNAAAQNINLLLLDHAHCEKKAAATALGLIYRYADKHDLIAKMSRLAREELLHFEQVLKLLNKNKMAFQNIKPGKYATHLHKHITNHEPKKLVDTLIVGAFIEARSCERFKLLSEHIETDLAVFYQRLHLAEARHCHDYLQLAARYSDDNIDARIEFFGHIEAELIGAPDAEFRFHSGVPICFISSNSTPSSIKSPIPK